MAFNLAGITNAFTEFARGVGEQLGLVDVTPGQLYPEDESLKKIQNQINESNWNKLSFPYTFAVANITRDTIDDSGVFKKFPLNLPPSEITQSEDFATSIKPTQGGTVVTHSGNKYKMLNISGTTGISPFRGMAGVDALTGKVIAKPEQLKYKSGHEVFLELRNWFKTYYQYKATKKDDGKNLRLIFQNFKDGEFLIVELIKFNMKRTAEESFLYRYELNFKVLGNFTFTNGAETSLEAFDSTINRALNKIDTARGIFLASQDLLRTVESSYNSSIIEPLRKISLAAKAAAGVAITAADVGNRIVKNTVTAASALNIMKTIKDQQKAAQTGQDATIPQSIQNANTPSDLESAVSNQGADIITNLNEALLDLPVEDFPEATNAAMERESLDAQGLQRSFYSNAVVDLKRIKNNAEDAFNLGSSTYDSLFDRTATLNAETIKQTTFEEFELLRGFNEAITGVNMLISNDFLFKSDFSTRIDSIQQSFVDELDLQSLPATKSIIMPGNTDLEQLALEELNDPTRWIEIAELNDLRAPFVVQDLSDTRSNIIRPGESLLIPQNIVEGLPTIPKGAPNRLVAGLSEIEKSLGVDLKVNDEFDLIIMNSGDVDMIAGLQNMAQAVVLKLGYERGELRNHPTLGIGVQVGSKFNTLEEIRDRILDSLLQDPRVETITGLSLRRDGPALFLNFEIIIKRVDNPIPLQVKL